MLGKKTSPKALPKMRGLVLYRGPSMLDGAPIVVIATLSTSNVKTGDAIQTWILREDINPVEATKTGEDLSICGSCPHRHYNNGACYVNVGQAPNQIWKSYKRGLYPEYDHALHADYFRSRVIRLGAYGDPAAVPFEVLHIITRLTRAHTGYTHQAAHKNFDQRYFKLCQVSADSPKQASKYQRQGAKTFRVAMEGDGLLPGEIECLSDSDGIQCIDCKLCDGVSQNIAIAVHGSRSNKFNTAIIARG